MGKGRVHAFRRLGHEENITNWRVLAIIGLLTSEMNRLGSW